MSRCRLTFPVIENLPDEEAGAAVRQWAVEQTALAFQALSRPGLHVPEEARRRVAALALGEAREPLLNLLEREFDA